MSAAAALDELRDALGASHVDTSAEGMAPHLTEGRGLYSGSAIAVVSPGSTEEVAEVMRAASRHGVPVVPHGGNTGLVGGGVPTDAIVLSMRRMNRIREIDALNSTMTVDAGCILQSVHEVAADAGRLFPLSLASQGSCQIGGNLATNAGGLNVLRYGNTRELALGLEVVLPDGRILSDLTALRKNNTGYDLRDLFIGSEGTLGVITAAVLKLFPLPRQRVTAFAGCADPHKALALYDLMRGSVAENLSAFEYLPRFGLEIVLTHADGATDPLAGPHAAYALLELTSPDASANLRGTLEGLLGRAFEDGLIEDATIGASETQNLALWRLRESMSEMQKFEGGSIKHDVAVPVSRVADLIDEGVAACLKLMPDCRPCPFGHFGDGNLHFNITQPKGMEKAAFLSRWPDFNHAIHDIVAGMHGSISAEHGIGLVKREELKRYKDPVALEVMRAIKAALDPQGIMNPGKVL
jgi:FAD/FMN-containing dehydrogenase